MRKRNIQIIVRLNRKEQEHLQTSVKRSGLSQEAYLRQLIRGAVPKEAPPADYYGMMRELHAIGNNLNQITRKANAFHMVDAPAYDQMARALEKSIRDITRAVILPDKR